MTPSNPIIPYGYCHCGCGQKTKISRWSDATHGYVRGEPRKYIRFHSQVRHSHYINGKQDRTLSCWLSMIQRCTNPNNQAFRHYGGRGIKVSENWRSFPAFLSDMGEAPEGKEIERIDNNKGYEKGNCNWATRKEQMRNTRRNRWFMWQGEMRILRDIQIMENVPHSTLHAHLAKGESISEAIECIQRRRSRLMIGVAARQF